MKPSVKNQRHIPRRSASQSSGNNTQTKAVGFLMLYMTAIVLNVGQTQGKESTTSRFAAVFLTLFVATFILNKGQLGLATIYLLLAQIAPALGQPVMIGTLFLLYVFLLQ